MTDRITGWTTGRARVVVFLESLAYPEAAKLIYTGLFSLQHRGQEGAGIVASDGEQIRSIKGMGLLNEVFTQRPPSTLPGHLGIGHVRYSTTGSHARQNVQPMVFECIGRHLGDRPQREPDQRTEPAPVVPGGRRHFPDQHRQRNPGAPDRRPDVPLAAAPRGTRAR